MNYQQGLPQVPQLALVTTSSPWLIAMSGTPDVTAFDISDRRQAASLLASIAQAAKAAIDQSQSQPQPEIETKPEPVQDNPQPTVEIPEEPLVLSTTETITPKSEIISTAEIIEAVRQLDFTQTKIWLLDQALANPQRKLQVENEGEIVAHAEDVGQYLRQLLELDGVIHNPKSTVDTALRAFSHFPVVYGFQGKIADAILEQFPDAFEQGKI
jgi:hypothetical protein